MAKQVKQYLDTLASRRTSNLSGTVRECIYVMLPSGLCSIDNVANRLGLNRRTLHRHLAREGQTFSSIIDAVRTELATRYISNRDLTSISDLLGFSARSAFSRWFRGQFGCSVSEWRATQLPSVKSKGLVTGVNAERPSHRAKTTVLGKCAAACRPALSSCRGRQKRRP
jgi:AraC-like DNA-binding protein